MGSVYLAEDPMLKRRLAIKVVRAVGEERDIALERFKREAEISAQLNHPNIVTIYDVGEEPGVGPFLPRCARQAPRNPPRLAGLSRRSRVGRLSHSNPSVGAES